MDKEKVIAEILDKLMFHVNHIDWDEEGFIVALNQILRVSEDEKENKPLVVRQFEYLKSIIEEDIESQETRETIKRHLTHMALRIFGLKPLKE